MVVLVICLTGYALALPFVQDKTTARKETPTRHLQETPTRPKTTRLNATWNAPPYPKTSNRKTQRW